MNYVLVWRQHDIVHFIFSNLLPPSSTLSLLYLLCQLSVISPWSIMAEDPNVERFCESDVRWHVQSKGTSLDVIVLKKVEVKKDLWTVAVGGTRWRRCVSPWPTPFHSFYNSTHVHSKYQLHCNCADGCISSLCDVEFVLLTTPLLCLARHRNPIHVL